MIDIVSSEAFERVKLILHDIPGGAEKALYGVISRATTTIRKVSLDGITSIYDIKAKDVRDRKNTTINTKTQRVDGGVVGHIHYSGNLIPLYRFGVKPREPRRKSHRVPINIGGNWVMARPSVEVRARQRKDRPFARMPNTFVATMRSGHTGIFQRPSRNTSAIGERMGASTAHMAGTADVMKKSDVAAQEAVVNRTEHEISRILNGWGR